MYARYSHFWEMVFGLAILLVWMTCTAATGYMATLCSLKHYQPYGCPAGKIISITSATVGYTRRYYFLRQKICRISDSRVQCRTPTNTSDIMKCNGRQLCSLSFDALNYPGNFTCQQHQTGNFIQIKYNCIAGYAVTICRTNPPLFIGCPTDNIINITSATVGSSIHVIWAINKDNRLRLCIVNDDFAHCREPTNSPDITQCNARQNCSLSLNAFNYPETFSCYGQRTGNFMEIAYSCIIKDYTVVVCRTDNNEIYGQSIWCDDGRVINIISATVGYREDVHFTSQSTVFTTQIHECAINDHVQCRQHMNSEEILKCNGHRNCSLSLDAFLYFGTFTCDDRQKGNYIEITYNCIAETSSASSTTNQLSTTTPVYTSISTTNTLTVRETAMTSVSNPSSNAKASGSSNDAGPIIGVSVGMGLLLLIVIVICIVIVLVIVFKNRRNRMSSGPRHLRAVTTPNIYETPNAAMSQHGSARDNVVEMNPVEPRPTPAVNGSEYANVPVSGGVYPSLPPDSGSLSKNATLIDDDLCQ